MDGRPSTSGDLLAAPLSGAWRALTGRVPARLRGWLGRGTVAGASAAYLAGLAAVGLVVDATHDMPELSKITERSRPVSIRFLDRYGRELLVRGGHSGAPIDAGALPAHVRDAVTTIEDARFAHHIGVDAEAILRAAVANHRAGRKVQGGSTLTQQLVKNVYLSPEKTYRRKVQEALLAVALERRHTKNEILELYLERVYFGAGLWGLDAAAHGYFGVAPTELTVSQAAVLAGVLKAPSASNPLSDPGRAGARAALVLDRMAATRRIDTDLQRTALSEPLRVRAPSSSRGVNAAADWLWPEVESRLGLVTTDIDVHTTLDADIQLAAESAVHLRLDPARGAEEAAVVVLGANGDVLAMVGGASYADSQFNRAVQARRQPGSAFKPFVYLTALEAGLSPWDYRVDAPLMVEGWTAENFGDRYHGLVSLSDAFAKSLNTVAVGLSEEVGRERVVATAARFRLDTQPLPSVSLGAQGASPLELAGAYLPFATHGAYSSPYGLQRITTRDGTPLYSATPEPPERVVAPGPLRDLNTLMKGTVRRGTGTRARVPGFDIAGKTGTTNAHRDAWFAGISPGRAAVVWVGNDANTPMDGITGGSIPAQIFADVMGATLQDQPSVQLPSTPEPIYAAPTDPALDSLLSAIEEALP